MQQAYPVIFTRDGESLIAEFPDVPEAITIGSDEDSALEWAQDALIVALSGYLDERRDIPVPSKLKPGQQSVVLPPLIAAKLAIYQALRDQGKTQTYLAAKLGCDAKQIRRLLDLNHHSRMDLIDDALRELGKMLIIDIKPVVMPKFVSMKKMKASQVR